MTEWPHFSRDELKCKCGCDQEHMDEFFMRGFLIPLRKAYGGPIILNSAYRCPEYNAKISTTGYDGPHTTGKAVDIRVYSGRHRYRIITLALRLGCNRVGVGKGFVHVDTCVLDVPQEVIWTY